MDGRRDIKDLVGEVIDTERSTSRRNSIVQSELQRARRSNERSIEVWHEVLTYGYKSTLSSDERTQNRHEAVSRIAVLTRVYIYIYKRTKMANLNDASYHLLHLRVCCDIRSCVVSPIKRSLSVPKMHPRDFIKI